MKKTKHIHCFSICQEMRHKTFENAYYLLKKKNLRDLGNSSTFFKKQIFSCVNSQPAATVIIFSK